MSRPIDPPRNGLRRLREAHNLTQTQLAKLAGVTASHIAHLERRGFPAMWVRLARMADALGVGADEILGRGAPKAVVTLVNARERELLDAMRDDALALLGERYVGRLGGWYTIARMQWLGHLIGARDRLLPRPAPPAIQPPRPTTRRRIAMAKAQL